MASFGPFTPIIHDLIADSPIIQNTQHRILLMPTRLLDAIYAVYLQFVDICAGNSVACLEERKNYSLAMFTLLELCGLSAFGALNKSS